VTRTLAFTIQTFQWIGPSSSQNGPGWFIHKLGRFSRSIH